VTGLYDWGDEPDLTVCDAVDAGHLCSRPDGHDGDHHCQCGHTWARVPHPSSGPP